MLIVSYGDRDHRNSGGKALEGRVHAGMGNHEYDLAEDLQLRGKRHHQQIGREPLGKARRSVAPPRDTTTCASSFPVTSMTASYRCRLRFCVVPKLT